MQKRVKIPVLLIFFLQIKYANSRDSQKYGYDNYSDQQQQVLILEMLSGMVEKMSENLIAKTETPNPQIVEKTNAKECAVRVQKITYRDRSLGIPLP